MTEEHGDEGFLKRWSRRKREADSSVTPSNVDPKQQPSEDRAHLADSGTKTANLSEPSQAGEPEAERQGDGESDKAAQDFSDFDYKSLDANSDYTRFMKDDVPSDVRAKALQQLWFSDPQFAHIDGLLEYAEDYTDAAVVPIGAVATAYRVGKGFLSDDEVKEWEKLGKKDDEEEDDDARDALANEDGEGGDGDGVETAQDAEGSEVVEDGDIAMSDDSETKDAEPDERDDGDAVAKKPA